MKNVRINKAFTLVEILVAVALLVVVMAMASTVFRVGIGSQRMAQANAEIMQKFRTITDQLDADFRGLCKEGEIFIVWQVDPNQTRDGASNPDYGKHTGFDRIGFFTKGDFQSYKTYNGQVVRGNVARVSYMLGKQQQANGVRIKSESLEPNKRTLFRTQHILTQDEDLDAFEPMLDANVVATKEAWASWHNDQEYDKITMQQWLDMDESVKLNALSVMTDTKVQNPDLTDRQYWGSQYDPNDPASYAHSLLSEGVGSFKIQGWFETTDSGLTGRRWIPDDDPDQDGSHDDSELLISQAGAGANDVWVPGLLYPGNGTQGFLTLGGEFTDQQFESDNWVDHFNEFPGLGRALKFTFTLYDSRGLIPQGRTFTHIVYLDR